MFDLKYNEWKDWSNENFAKLNSDLLLYYDAEFKEIINSFPNHADEFKVLEIGFGNGTLLKYFCSYGCQIYGTEVNSLLLNIANNFGYKVGNPDSLLSMGNESFDLIVAMDVLEHLTKEEILKSFSLNWRLLSKGGLFIFRVPNVDSFCGLPLQFGDITHITAIGSGLIRQLAKSHGFDILELRGHSHVIPFRPLSLFFYRILIIPIKFCVNVLLNFIFSPRVKINYTSQSLVAVLKKK